MTTLQDVRFALRQLRRSPGFAATAIVTLALGIGANVVVFGVLQGMLLQSIDTPRPREVFTIEHATQGYINVSYLQFEDVRDRNLAFSKVAAYQFNHFGVDVGGARTLWGTQVTGEYFNLLEVKPVLGRTLQPADADDPGGPRNAVISYSLWKGLYSGDPHIIGKTVDINKLPFTIVGVTPQSFYGTEKFFSPEIYLSMAKTMELVGYDYLKDRGDENIFLVGRLRPGLTPAQANADLSSLSAQMAKENPKTDEDLHLRVAQPGFLGDWIGGPVKAFLAGVMLLAALVLLAACANLGGLFAARTADRTREFAIRLAIGSSKRRVLRQILTEALVLSLIGGAFACGLAFLLLRTLQSVTLPSEIPLRVGVTPHPLQLLVAFFVSVAAGVLFGLVPARQIFAADPNQAIKSGTASTATGHRWALREILLAAQIALCCLVVTAAFVSLRGLNNALRLPFGFQPKNVVRISFDLQLAGYKENDILLFQRKLIDQVNQVAGVESAAYASSSPLSLNSSNTNIYDERTTELRSSAARFLSINYNVSPNYFATAGTRLLSGRDFTWSDDDKAPRVAIVNQRFARELFGTDNAIGRHFKTGSGKLTEIIGIVEDGKYMTLTEEPRPALFNPIQRTKDSTVVLLVRTASDPLLMTAQLRRVLHNLDPGVPIDAAGPWLDHLAIMLLPARAATIALSIFGALALLLSVTGTFGLASYTVSRRLRELGLRVALGAQARQIVQTALGRTLTLLFSGSVVGLLLGFAASRLLSAVVAHASAQDPLVLLAVVATMLVAGALSVAAPARRALTANPALLLRDE